MTLYNRVVCNNISTKWASWDASFHQNPTSPGTFLPRKFVVRRHRHSNHSTVSTTLSSDLKSRFIEVYDSIKSDLLHDPSFEFDGDSHQWVERMIDYNIPRGKMILGLTVMESYQLLKREKLTDEEVYLACALGWCTEWLQAYILIHDDIIDDSHRRGGHPCWYRLPEVGMVAINDAVILRNHIPRILKKYFHEKSYYMSLLDLFNEVDFRAISGQLIDATTKLAGGKNLLKYSMSNYHRIVQYKGSYYTLYLPVVCALHMFGANLDDLVQMEDIFVKMAIYGQMKDDYLDTFGDPNVVGKTGTDIENSRCSWLIVKAMEIANDDQKKIICVSNNHDFNLFRFSSNTYSYPYNFQENYGIKDPNKVAKVVELFHSLNLQGVFRDYENKTSEELIKSIEALPSKPIQGVLKFLLGKVYSWTK